MRDYAIVRHVSAKPEHDEFVRALGHEPGQVFYLAGATAVLEWTDDPDDALRVTIEEARYIIDGIRRMQRGNSFYEHQLEPPEPMAEA